MKASKHEMHKSMLRLKHPEQVSDEEHKSTKSLRQEQPKNMQGTRHVMYKST